MLPATTSSDDSNKCAMRVFIPIKRLLVTKNTRRLSGSSAKPIKSITVNAKTVPIVKKAFQLRAEGVSYIRISRKLADLGFISRNTSKPFQCNVIERMLRNKFYIGIMTCDGKEYPHKYPQIISKELFSRCQLVKRERSISETKAKYNSRTYTFKSIVSCGRCNRAVSPTQ